MVERIVRKVKDLENILKSIVRAKGGNNKTTLCSTVAGFDQTIEK